MTTAEHTATQRGQYVQANGLDIYYEEQGEGPPLLLIHGGILTGESWQLYLPSFAKHFRVVMPDSREHGRTHNPTGEMSFGTLADDMVALVRALGLHKPLIFGYSDGGRSHWISGCATLTFHRRWSSAARTLSLPKGRASGCAPFWAM